MLNHSLARDAGLAAAPPIAGSRAGLCAGTRVMTLDGHIPVEFLSPGDSIITRNGTRKLIELHRFWLLDSAVLIPKGAFGKNSPVADLQVGPSQALQLRDAQFGSATGPGTTAIPAHRVVQMAGLSWVDHAGDSFVFQLEFDDYYTFYAEGLEVVSHLPGLSTLGLAAE